MLWVKCEIMCFLLNDFFFFCLKIFIYLAALFLSCGVWDFFIVVCRILVAVCGIQVPEHSGMEPRLPALRMQSLS